MNVKVAAEKLMKLADAIEKQAAESTYFVCDNCNHTATLSTINQRRKEAADESGIRSVKPVQVDHKVSCPACIGMMSYVASETSERYYEAMDAMPASLPSPGQDPLQPPPPMDDSQQPPMPSAQKPPVAPMGQPGDTFQPVDEQPVGDSYPGDEGGEGIEDKGDLGTEPGDSMDDETKPEDKPLDEEGAPEDKPLGEDGLPEEGAPEDKPLDEEGAPEEGALPSDEELPKPEKAPKATPKFEKMPSDKEASERGFWASVNRYQV